jgi:hypothetical protein
MCLALGKDHLCHHRRSCRGHHPWGDPFPVSIRSAHVIHLIILICTVTDRLGGKSLFFVFGKFHLYPNLVALEISKDHDNIWDYDRVGRVK